MPVYFYKIEGKLDVDSEAAAEEFLNDLLSEQCEGKVTITGVEKE